MISNIPAVKPTQINVDWYIARAHRMRGEYFAQIFKFGFGYLRELVAQRDAPKASAAAARAL